MCTLWLVEKMLLGCYLFKPFEKPYKKDANTVRDSAHLKNKCIWPDGSHGLFITCRWKKWGIHVYILNCCDRYYLAQDSFFSQVASYIHTWVAKRWQHCSERVHPHSFLKADQVFHSPCGIGRLAASQLRLGLAVLAWLAQILLLIATKTFINHTYTYHG